MDDRFPRPRSSPYPGVRGISRVDSEIFLRGVSTPLPPGSVSSGSTERFGARSVHPVLSGLPSRLTSAVPSAPPSLHPSRPASPSVLASLRETLHSRLPGSRAASLPGTVSVLPASSLARMEIPQRLVRSAPPSPPSLPLPVPSRFPVPFRVQSSESRRLWQLKAGVVPAFSGEVRSFADTRDYLVRCVTAFTFHCLEPADWVPAAISGFSGYAQRWAAQQAQGDGGVFSTWYDFEGRVLERFSAHTDSSSAMHRLQRLYQRRDESVDDYYLKFSDIAVLLPFDAPTALPSIFSRGVRKDLLAEIDLSLYDQLSVSGTVEDWLYACRAAERKLQRLGQLDSMCRCVFTKHGLRLTDTVQSGQAPSSPGEPADQPPTPTPSVCGPPTNGPPASNGSSRQQRCGSPPPPRRQTATPGNQAAQLLRTGTYRDAVVAGAPGDAPQPAKFKNTVYDFINPTGAHRQELLSKHLCFRCESDKPKKHPYWKCTAEQAVHPFEGGVRPGEASRR